MLKCQRCEHEWRPRTDEMPKECPKCKSYFWQVSAGDMKAKGRVKSSSEDGSDTPITV